MSNVNSSEAEKTAKTVGISAQVPLRMRDALFSLSELTGMPASHHLRLALSRYLMSEDVKNQRDEAISYKDMGC